MATREENLKKINDELEKLDDEQLEQVAGGILKPLDKTIIRNIDEDPVANQLGVKNSIQWIK